MGPADHIAQKHGDTLNHDESTETYPMAPIDWAASPNSPRERRGGSRPPNATAWACAHYSFVTYVAAVVQVTVTARRIDPTGGIAVDCRRPSIRTGSRPDGGCVHLRMSAARFGEISFKNGRAQQNNFDTYRGGARCRQRRGRYACTRAWRLRQAAGRSGRTRRAAGASCAVQCDLCGDGQAHPGFADSRSAEGLELGAGRQPIGAYRTRVATT